MSSINGLGFQAGYRPLTSSDEAKTEEPSAFAREEKNVPERPEWKKGVDSPISSSKKSAAPGRVSVSTGSLDITADLRMLQGATTSLDASRIMMKIQQKLISAGMAAGFEADGKKTTSVVKRIRKAVNTASRKVRNLQKEELLQARQRSTRKSEELEALRESLKKTRKKNRQKEDAEFRKLNSNIDEPSALGNVTSVGGASNAGAASDMAIDSAVDALPAEVVAVEAAVSVDAVATVAAPSLNIVV